MLREVVGWSCLAIPTAGLLVAIAAFGFEAAGQSYSSFEASSLPGALAFLLWQTVGAVALWVGLTTRWPVLRRHVALEATLFPLAVALVGGVAAISGAAWPRSFDALAISVVGWLGFSWAILASRFAADRWFSRHP